MVSNALVAFSFSMAFKLKLPITGIIKKTIFAQFCGGENINECQQAVKLLNSYNIGTILDYSVEGEETNEAFEATTEETIQTINKAINNPAIPFSVFKVTGVQDSIYCNNGAPESL